MYVDPFWFGVLCTIIVELIGFFVFALYCVYRENKKGE